ncbi:formate dehydrogenase subunit beta [Oecophyllibacter saccharovorans]|uniref:Formate dehydrogenase subunit beta n=1 Tax=Oecophyllibacter saccharovorans TaxID=2558360 RepID=A0A506URR9_9PROT|nr:formate dehydrogenase subunit beta [Oecophyllibacter saccharovorans]QDH14899.1 formate dehydrogenase subunit beta [Oecophyllibacter saccharovorans]TPW36038.1 formate dehydrogenase subunit beta [Oecophyllibacter saccharovorans]
MTLQSQDVIRRSATNGLTPPPDARHFEEQVTKLIDVTICTGCKACQGACDEWNNIRDKVGTCDGTYNNPRDLSPETWTVIRFDEYVDPNGKLEWLMRKDGCMHCQEPGCLKSCPAPGAIVQFANGIVDFESEHCIGCGYCMIGCPFNIPRVSEKDNHSYKCTLCADRVAVGQEPACAKTCTTGAISFGNRKEMLELAEARVAELKTRGFAEAGIYNPQGVGGTHVVYVLQHANDPEIYHGLPKNPEISPLVRGWKDWLKPIGALGFIGTIAAAFAHFAGVGPNTDQYAPPIGEEEEKTLKREEREVDEVVDIHNRRVLRREDKAANEEAAALQRQAEQASKKHDHNDGKAD